MKLLFLLVFLVSSATVTSGGFISDAAAKRLGGGLSFGSKPTYRTPYSKAAPSRQASRPSAARQKNVQARAAWGKRGGLTGLLGGLALGGLLGALFFGGAFEGINFFDVLMFGGIAFALYKILAYRRQRTLVSPAARRGLEGGGVDWERGASTRRPAPDTRGSQTLDTDVLFGSRKPPVEAPAPRSVGFDEKGFLQSAERAYRHLQEAWDRGDMTELQGLTTPSVFKALQEQVQSRDGNNHTEILKLDTELLEVKELQDQLEAAVLFDALMRESDEVHEAARRPRQVREVWHFIRPVRSGRPTWYLDGIQQLAAQA